MDKVEPIAVRIFPEFGEMIGVGRSKAYEVVKAHPELLIDIDGAQRVSVERARRLFAPKQEAQGRRHA